MPRVLLVDDDEALCEMLREYLEPEALDLVIVHDGAQALERLAEHAVDLIILDVMLPGMNGFDVLRRVRERGTTPVIMLTARGDDVDRIVGLEIGADDYLPKPFNPRELTARMRAILRRARMPARTPAIITVGPLTLNPASLTAEKDGRPLKLTGAELRLLETLMRRPGEVISRDALTDEVLGRKLTPFDRAIDTHVSNLRRKLGCKAGNTSLIRNVRGAGYMLVPDGE